mgnify:CR=1 FL=1
MKNVLGMCLCGFFAALFFMSTVFGPPASGMSQEEHIQGGMVLVFMLLCGAVYNMGKLFRNRRDWKRQLELARASAYQFPPIDPPKKPAMPTRIAKAMGRSIKNDAANKSNTRFIVPTCKHCGGSDIEMKEVLK